MLNINVCVCVCAFILSLDIRDLHRIFFFGGGGFHCQLWPVELYRIFHIVSKTVRFLEKKLLNIKYVLTFSTAFVRNVFHYKKN